MALCLAIYLAVVGFHGIYPGPGLWLGYLLMPLVAVAALAFGLRAGLIAGLLAAAAYAWISTLAFPRPAGSALLPLRVILFVAVGIFAAVIADQVRGFLQGVRSFSLVDEATGLYNEVYLRSRLEEELHRCRRYPAAFTLIKITFPRVISMSESAKGLYLRKAARIISRRTVDICCRGGDKIFFLLPQTDWTSAGAFASRVMRELQEAGLLANLPPSEQPVVHLVGFPEEEEALLEYLGLKKDDIFPGELKPAATPSFGAPLSIKSWMQ